MAVIFFKTLLLLKRVSYVWALQRAALSPLMISSNCCYLNHGALGEEIGV